jgi:hypothetical protein
VHLNAFVGLGVQLKAHSNQVMPHIPHWMTSYCNLVPPIFTLGSHAEIVTQMVGGARSPLLHDYKATNSIRRLNGPHATISKQKELRLNELQHSGITIALTA